MVKPHIQKSVLRIVVFFFHSAKTIQLCLSQFIKKFNVDGAKGCCVPPIKKRGEEARGFTTVRGAPQNGDGRTCVRQTEPQEILCIAMRVSDLG